MIALSNLTVQTLTTGQSITFDSTVLRTCSSAEGHRQSTPAVKLRVPGIYEVHFTGNVSSATAATPVQLAIAIGGSTLPGTLMVSTPSAANAENNVHADTIVRNACGEYDTITVTNVGTNPVIVSAGSGLWVKRVA